jgi:hypothetical protein
VGSAEKSNELKKLAAASSICDVSVERRPRRLVYVEDECMGMFVVFNLYLIAVSIQYKQEHN